VTYRAAVIGCGKIGSEYASDPRIKDIYTHAGAYSSCRDTSLVAVCDIDRDRARRCAERWGVPSFYEDYLVMLREVKPEIVSICTPDETHAAILGEVIADPLVKGVLAEKPLAMDEDDAARLVSLAERLGVVLVVNYSRRYASNHHRVRDLLRKGSIGRIQCMNGYYTGGCLHSGTHWFDLARFLVGEITAVQGFDLLGEEGPDPTLDARIIFEGGATGTLQGCDSRAFGIFEADIIGTAGRVRILDSGHRVELSVAGENPHYTGYRSLSIRESWDTGFEDLLLHAVEDLVDCLKQGGIPASSGRDGVAALRIASAVRRSAQEGRPVPTVCEGHD